MTNTEAPMWIKEGIFRRMQIVCIKEGLDCETLSKGGSMARAFL
jgi:hypothetical protein